MAGGTKSVAQAIASGTQNLAGIIGLFSTDAVEKNALATNLGNGTVVISSLSMLDIMGLVKSTLKILLGLERCRAAGLDLDAVRGLLGYAPEETAATGQVVDCDLITVDFLNDVIRIHKIKRGLDSKRSPIVVVGSGWPELGLRWKTAVNLGNAKRESAWSQSPWFSILFGMLCTGIMSWLLLVIDAPWTLVTWFATAGFQACLMFMLALPLWFERQTGRVEAHLTLAGWYRLWDLDGQPPIDESGPSVYTSLLQADKPSPSTRMNLLQAKVAGGDVLHFQGDVSFLQYPVLRVLALIVSAGTAIAYVCQYAIVVTASNRQAIIWVTCQAAAALFRVLYWIIHPSFDDPQTNKGEFALVNNREELRIFLPALLCACEPGETQLPLWVWKYLKDTDLNVILKAAAERTIHNPVPGDLIMPRDAVVSRGTREDNLVCTLLNVDFDRIVQRRLENHRWDVLHRDHKWRLAFWRYPNVEEVHPVVLVEIPYFDQQELRDCWMEAAAGRVNTRNDGRFLLNPCKIFAATKDGPLHITSRLNVTPQSRSLGYIHGLEHADTSDFVHDRLKMCEWIKRLFDKPSQSESAPLSYMHANMWGNAVWVSITSDTIDRHDKRWGRPGQRIFGQRLWQNGLKRLASISIARIFHASITRKVLRNLKSKCKGSIQVRGQHPVRQRRRQAGRRVFKAEEEAA